MFTRASTFIVLGLSILAAASGIPASQCNTGDLQCCNQVEPATSNIAFSLEALFGIVPGSVSGLIGLTCSPITIIGLGGNFCSQQPVCCTDNSWNGVIAFGCTPVNINL
ncbi:hypothetical protein GALMADRAFT_76053 [Galerina marginata CBS 339.88]|uniref:Hydrophobin n=1 Tax=Galerina marginata (strain CBS 339.88) TaxID=685588 RepID=A0A067SI78_GALM3|nr:hypothetical protein GALMADRAFT_76053 [Galerina marginata CBS 339.88]